MDCKSEFTISLFGMMFFTGFAIGSLILPPISDKFGRKNYFVGCLIVALAAFIAMLLIIGHDEKYMYTYIVLMFIIGLQQGGRYTIGYCYMMEMAPANYHGMMGTMWGISETFVYMVDTLYFRYVSKQWRYVIIFAASE